MLFLACSKKEPNRDRPGMALFSFCIGAPASPVAISFSPQLFGYSTLVIGILVIVSWLLVF
jgi:hypothetical protein